MVNRSGLLGNKKNSSGIFQEVLFFEIKLPVGLGEVIKMTEVDLDHNEISPPTFETSIDVHHRDTEANVTLSSLEISYPLDAQTLTAVLEAFYLIHNPDRISTIPTILEKYSSNQLDLIQNLKERYNIDNYKPFDDIIAAAGPASQVSHDLAQVNVKGNDLIVDGIKSNSARHNLPNSSSNGMVGLSAALSLNMQDIAGVSSNIIAGTGRLFNGVSVWGLASTSSNNHLSPTSSIKTTTPTTTAADYISYAANKLNNVNDSIQSKIDSSEISNSSDRGSAKSNPIIQPSSSKEDLNLTSKIRILEVDTGKLERENNELETEGIKLKATV